MGNLSAILGGINRIRGGTTQVTVQRPDLSGGTNVVAAAGPWAYGSWTQIAAANDLAAHSLFGITFNGQLQTSNAAFQVQIGTGSTDAEVAIGTAFYSEPSGASGSGLVVFPTPLQIPANARVAARAASGGSNTATVTLFFVPRPT